MLHFVFHHIYLTARIFIKHDEFYLSTTAVSEHTNSVNKLYDKQTSNHQESKTK